MSPTLLTVSYLAATILFVLSLGGLSNPETSRRGNLYGMIGMALAVLATVFGPRVTPAGLAWIAAYADGIGPNKRLIFPMDKDRHLLPPTSLIEDAHRVRLQVHPWTFRSDPQFLAPEYEGRPEREVEQFYELGVDGVFSDFPAAMIRQFLLK